MNGTFPRHFQRSHYGKVGKGKLGKVISDTGVYKL